jgi:hypothetical protein
MRERLEQAAGIAKAADACAEPDSIDDRARKPMNRLDDFNAALAAADALEILRMRETLALEMSSWTAICSWVQR